MRRNKAESSDALRAVDAVYGKDEREWTAGVEEERVKFEVAIQLHKLRTEAGLTQCELAKLVGTSHSHIARLEDAEYEGHSLSMLRRIAAALNSRVEIRIVPGRQAKPGRRTSRVAP